MSKKIFVFFVFIVTNIALVACSSNEQANPDIKEGWFQKTKCKILKKNDECD